MKLNFKQLAMFVGVGMSIMLMSCSKFGGSNVSNTTGWAYNDPDWGGFEYQSGYEQQTGPAWAEWCPR